MIKDGLVEEIESLLKQGVTFEDQCMQGIGYKEWKGYFDGMESMEECVDLIKRNSHHFAKRQYTFFQNQLDVRWFYDLAEARQEVEKWLI